MAIAFLPNPEVLEAYSILENLFLEKLPVLNKLLEYFSSHWLHSYQMWNVHCHHLRTNNDLEAWHFAMQRSIKKSHPDIFTFIGKMVINVIFKFCDVY